MTTTTYVVSGLHCGGCVSTLEAALSAVAGVQAAVVNLDDQTATVTGEVDLALLATAATTVGKVLCTEKNSTSLHVGGMSCGHCSSRVQAALVAVPGVESAEVDWESGAAEIVGTASSEELVAAVEATGKSATVVSVPTPPAPPSRAPDDALIDESTIALRVDGMSCGHCSSQVEKALVAVSGVATAEVDLESGRATVVGTASADALLAAVEATGKHATLEPSQVTYSVQGLMCQGCIATVTRVLRGVEGVSSASVFLHSGKALVTGVAVFEELQRAVRTGGKFGLARVESNGRRGGAEKEGGLSAAAIRLGLGALGGAPLAEGVADGGVGGALRSVRLRVDDMICNGCKEKVHR